MNFAVPADLKVKMKENEKIEGFDLARKLKELWNTRATVIIIMVVALETVPIDEEKKF